MSENNSDGLRALLSEVMIKIDDNVYFKVEKSTVFNGSLQDGIFIKIKRADMHKEDSLFLNFQQSIDVMQAINTISRQEFRSEYSELFGKINEQSCEIKNLKELLKEADKNSACMQNTIREYSDRMAMSMLCAEKLEEEFRNIEATLKSQRAEIENTEEAFIRQSAVLQAKENRINEYKKQLEQAHKHIELIAKGKTSFNKKKWKRKYKENLRQKLEENNEKFYSEIKSIINDYEVKIEGKNVEVHNLQKKVSELNEENKRLKHSEFITIGGNPIKSEFLKYVAISRARQFATGRTIEKDVINNKENQLLKAAVYCIDSDSFFYPESWDEDEGLKKNIDLCDEFGRLIYAATFIIAHLDMKYYIKSKNEEFEKLKNSK